jgi:hypothetical protein
MVTWLVKKLVSSPEPKIHHHVHKNPTMDRLYLTHTLWLYFFKVERILVSWLMSVSYNGTDM